MSAENPLPPGRARRDQRKTAREAIREQIRDPHQIDKIAHEVSGSEYTPPPRQDNSVQAILERAAQREKEENVKLIDLFVDSRFSE
jgi:acetylornithine deacetylase/succinyl-diaminopimelate desuccinylase-like protein